MSGFNVKDDDLETVEDQLERILLKLDRVIKMAEEQAAELERLREIERLYFELWRAVEIKWKRSSESNSPVDF